MSIKIALIVDDIEFNVLDFFFGFFQNSDYTGRPVSTPNAYPFKFTIEASKDITFVEWAMHATMQKKRVKIVFSPVNGMSKSTTIELLDVYCVFCQYHFSSTGNDPLTVSFDLSPATIIRDGEVLLKRYWAVTDPAMFNAAPTQRETEDNEPRITKQYITDREDVELDEYKRGDKIYYVLESENMIDESVDIELHNKEFDFLYKDKLLKDDTIKNYIIISNIDKIPLEVIPEDYED